ncbi:MAG TPA: hypothetical protein VFK14_02530 [Solirubrobacterales bacterium]|nr:hypothetical protein [Solirubrobacterales bacterium]
MGGTIRLCLGMLSAAVLAAAVAGCGSGSSTSAADTVTRPYPWVKGPAREFLVPGGDNAIPTFGEEGTSRERAEATTVVTAWLRARAAKNWKRECAYLSAASAKGLTKDAHGVTKGRVDSCAGALDYFKFEAHGNFESTLGGPIDSLRVGERPGAGSHPISLGWAMYHGTDGKDWIVPLVREGGEWKVSGMGPLQSQH